MDVKPLISPQELATLMEQESIVIIDTHDPAEYAVSHIPRAVSMREIFTYLATSTSDGLANLQSQFATLLGAAGISGKERIIVYEDAANCFFDELPLVIAGCNVTDAGILRTIRHAVGEGVGLFCPGETSFARRRGGKVFQGDCFGNEWYGCDRPTTLIYYIPCSLDQETLLIL
jgi:rhodanese-related sulfurtransferase